MSEADNVEVAVEATEAPARPEWLPEKFNTPEDLASSYSQLESKLGTSQEEMRKQLIDEFESAAIENRPASVGDYQVPENLDADLVNDNELFRWWANHAFENAYSQQEFEDGINMYAAALNANMPDLDAERTALGENADARIEAVDLWSQKFFPEEYQDAIMGLGASAKGIEALEFLMSQMSASSVGGNTAPIQPLNEADLQSMMKDERYWNPTKRDNAYVQKVQEGFSKLYR
ncbi:MAG: hypothetical protein CL525_16290 [Aequorivita sp.]|nr:hypothetical protein [Aequorivita sp.]